MKKNICMIGVGEIGGVFARAFLKVGRNVYPITRGMNLNSVRQEIPEPEAVIVAVGEKDIETTLKNLPKEWHDCSVLVQNELLPKDWVVHKIQNPTVISVWFEKKWPQDYKVIIPSPVYGPLADTVKEALATLNISVTVLNREEDLTFELILKNLYILTINIAGLVVGGNVHELWTKHHTLARDVASDVLDIQFKLVGKEFDREKLIEGMAKAFEGDLQHKCLGRTAPARLERAIRQSDEMRLEVKALRKIQRGIEKTLM